MNSFHLLWASLQEGGGIYGLKDLARDAISRAKKGKSMVAPSLDGLTSGKDGQKIAISGVLYKFLHVCFTFLAEG
jgi:hypothetical protein